MGTLDSGRSPWQTQSPPRSQTGRRGGGAGPCAGPLLSMPSLPTTSFLRLWEDPGCPVAFGPQRNGCLVFGPFLLAQPLSERAEGLRLGWVATRKIQQLPNGLRVLWAVPLPFPPGSLCSWTQESREVGPEGEGRQGPRDRPHPGDCPPAPCPRDPRIGTPRATTSHRTPRDPKVSQPQRALSPLALSPDSACSSLCSEGGARDPSKRLSGLTLRLCPGGLHRIVDLTWGKKMQHTRIDARFVFMNP